MSRYVLCVFLALSWAGTAWSQDESDDATPSETSASESSAAETASDEQGVDDSDLDEQVYTDTDDDFRPSEEIPADQSIAFPTDI